MGKRYQELDSLRGIAALTVLVHHFLLVFPIMKADNYSSHLPWFIRLIKYSPLHIFWAGSEAVILFFILSGFVLSLPFYKESRNSYSLFMLKRICRLYIPYAIAVFISIIMDSLVSKRGIPQLSDMINNSWCLPITWKLIVQHYLFIDSFRNYEFVPVLWSLIHEMRISIIFPVVMFLVIRFGWKRNIFIGVVLSIFGFEVSKAIYHTKFDNDFFLTFEYLIMFIVGALIAKHRVKLTNMVANFTPLKKWLLLACGVLCYTYAWLFKGISIIHKMKFDDWFILIGASIFVVSAISSNKLSKFLSINVVKFLGKISFSLYLYHGIVLLSLVNLLYGVIPTWMILIVSLFAAVIISTVAYYLIEEPSMRLGRKLTRQTSKETGNNTELVS